MRTAILRNHEFMTMNERGEIGRPSLRPPLVPSHTWRVVGAVTRNNFGHVTRFYTLAEIVNGDPIPWQHKNGKQKTFVRDFDHGSIREWTCNHSVF